MDTSALTGESVPREVQPESSVLSGCINNTGVLTIEVTKEFEDSTVAKILDLVENASSRKANAENFITKFARYYTPVVVIAAVLLAVIPPLFLGINSLDVWSEWCAVHLRFGYFLPLRTCHFYSAGIFRRNWRCIEMGCTCKRKQPIWRLLPKRKWLCLTKQERLQKVRSK